MNGDAVHHRNQSCPGCGSPTVILPSFVSRRRDPVTCSNCGAKLERVLPGAAYYTMSFVTAILTEVSVLPLLLLIFMHQWLWIAAVIVSLVIINLGMSEFLNSRTSVEFVDPADARTDKPGRWYPS